MSFLLAIAAFVFLMFVAYRGFSVIFGRGDLGGDPRAPGRRAHRARLRL